LLSTIFKARGLFYNGRKKIKNNNNFGAGATLQRCLVSCHLATLLTVCTDDMYPILYYLNFKTPSGTYLPI